jgi:hypothetical protein
MSKAMMITLKSGQQISVDLDAESNDKTLTECAHQFNKNCGFPTLVTLQLGYYIIFAREIEFIRFYEKS